MTIAILLPFPHRRLRMTLVASWNPWWANRGSWDLWSGSYVQSIQVTVLPHSPLSYAVLAKTWHLTQAYIGLLFMYKYSIAIGPLVNYPNSISPGRTLFPPSCTKVHSSFGSGDQGGWHGLWLLQWSLGPGRSWQIWISRATYSVFSTLLALHFQISVVDLKGWMVATTLHHSRKNHILESPWIFQCTNPWDVPQNCCEVCENGRGTNEESNLHVHTSISLTLCPREFCFGWSPSNLPPPGSPC